MQFLGGISADITERKRLEEQMRETQKLESLGVLAGGVAHDFNNLLTGILGNTSLALETIPRDNPARNVLDDVLRASERAAHLTRQMLAYAGKGRFLLEKVNLSQVVREIANLVQISIPKNVQLRLELDDQLPPIEADPGQIQQIVMNLVINGAEAIPADLNGTVLVTTGGHQVDEEYLRTLSVDEIPPGLYVALEVHDTGIGMDLATQAKIFDPFFSTKFAGRGLGLAATLGIVRGHKGAIKVYSTPARGTTFKVLFPATESKVRHTPEAAGQKNLRGSGTVLVVDDEEVVRNTARAMLERYGYSVLLAHDGQEAVDLYRAAPDRIAVVLLDLTMPVMGGAEAFRQLRLIRPNVRVILSSGYNEVEAIRSFTTKGIAGFIQKPYTSAHLAEKVTAVLEPFSGSASSPLPA